ncbi:TPA: hypothetical protein EYP66_22565 [Candidatus Poribacteria bacterium]|nr:hypothetical protein [Candidatus Poribacteria bacterium]
MEITVRKATMKDIPSVLKLWKRLMAFHRNLSKHFESERCASQSCSTRVLECNGIYKLSG